MEKVKQDDYKKVSCWYLVYWKQPIKGILKEMTTYLGTFRSCGSLKYRQDRAFFWLYFPFPTWILSSERQKKKKKGNSQYSCHLFSIERQHYHQLHCYRNVVSAKHGQTTGLFFQIPSSHSSLPTLLPENYNQSFH